MVARPAPAVAAVPVAPPVAPVDPVVALDPQIKRGTLGNGLTYYVMKHQKPEQRAALWLAVNAGSVLEDDDQRGLAHFVEHMAFNGTRRFPKQAIVDYMERAGIRFGADLNAYTAFDQTVYQLTVPTDNRDVLMKGFDILRDWAGDVSFDPVEVDKERGVVLEEWRLGRGPFARIRDRQWPVMFQGSRYAERLPIGLPETIKGAPRDKLVRFYKDWYRPHNMAVIAVGDFDPVEIEQAIAARFGDLAEPAQPRTRAPVPVPHDHELAVTIANDREMPFTQVAVYDKLAHRRNATRGDFRRFVVESLYHHMVNARLGELAQDPAAPITGAGSSTSELTRTCDGFIRSAGAKGGRVGDALAVLFREIARVEQYGFLPAELDRARRELVSQFENDAREWDKAPLRLIADEITRNFFDDEQMAGRRWELEAVREIAPAVTLDELNHLARSWGGARGRVVAIGAPADAVLPGEAEVRAIVAAATTARLEPWKDAGEVAARGLVEHPPAPGKVVATTHDAAADATVWTLGNGVRVVVKPTVFQNDEVMFTGWQLGGTSLVPDRDFVHARFAGEIMNASGAGELDAVALRKALAGKVAGANVLLGELGEQVQGSARPADLETALQLVYLKLTAPRRDERAFAAWKERQRDFLQHKTALPDIAFAEQMLAVTSGNHLRRRPATVEMLDQVDLDRALAIYRDRLSDLGGFTFVFVGNLELAALQPLVETYLGSLPAAGRKAHWKDVGIRYPVGRITKTVVAGAEAKSHVELSMGAPMRWSLDGERDAEILSMVLQIRLREVLREDMGGVYGVRINAFVTREPVQRRSLVISFGCDPANVASLQAAALAEIRAIAKAGIGADYLTKVTEQLRREREVNLKSNGWWRSRLRSAYYFHEDFARATDLDAMLKRVTSANVKASAARFLDEHNLVIGVLRPAAEAAKDAATPPAAAASPAPAPPKSPSRQAPAQPSPSAPPAP
ncbi:MAG: insulinase family protein [Deltaproteobacteria bacterium]|nr:MAG: insulinase family protein [Deltaproteobacteria bacterium]